MIRDLGTTVEFWITAGNGSSWDYDLGWSYSTPNGSSSGTFRYEAGMGWQRVASRSVTSSGNVTFSKADSGSTGLGGATSLTVYLSRATVPPAPSNIGLDEITHTGMRYRFSSNGTGGSSIIRWEYQCATNSSFSGVGVATSTGTTIRSDLAPGTKHYWRARGVNGVGTGPWSATISATTLPPLWIRVNGAWKKAIPYVKSSGVWKAAVAYLKSAGVWKESV